jgi:hypothetical protein
MWSRITAMSSSIPDSYIARHRATVHPFIAIVVPFVFLICMDPCLRGLFPAIDFPPQLFLPALLIIGIEVTVMGNVFLNERARFVARIQELAAVMTAMWIFTAAVYSIRARAFTLIHPAFVYPLALVLYQWTVTLTVHMHLREREFLLSALVGLEDEALLHALRDSSLQAGQSLKSLRAVIVLASAHLGISFVMYAICGAVQAPVPAWGYVACAAHAAFSLAVIGLMRVYCENQLLLGEGVVISGRLEGRRLIALFIIVAGAVPAAALASRDFSLLPISFIIGLLDKLSGLLAMKLSAESIRRIYEILRARSVSGNPFQGLPSAAGINPWIVLASEALRRLLITGIGAVLYFFLVSPLLSEEFLEGLRKRNPILFLLGKLRGFLLFWRLLGRRFREWLRWRGSGRRIRGNDSPASRLAAASSSAREKLSMRKRIQSGRMVKAFLQLLRWAERRGVSYRDYETLLEYSTRLIPIIPDSGSDVSLVVEVLEEALFSPHLIRADRTARYFSAIRGIRKTGAPLTF